MIITQVNLVLMTVKDHSKMWSFVTQHNATAISDIAYLTPGTLTCWFNYAKLVRVLPTCYIIRGSW